jgi:regulator of protease activity HflC (stomatin/prohibitin superfamily)
MAETTEEQSSLYKKFKWKIGDNMPYIVLFTLAALYLLAFLAPRILVTIHSGEAGVLFKRFSVGTVIDKVYPEGFYIVSPFNKMYKYNVRNQTHSHEMVALTLKGLPVTLKLSIRYLPHLVSLGVLHKKIGPDYLNIIVIPEVEASIRAIIGQFDPEQIYTTKRTVIRQLVNDMHEEVSQRFITIDDVLIREIVLPDTIAKAIENKLAERERLEAYQFILGREKQESERKRIEAAGIRDYQRIIAETLTDDILKVKGILATQEIAKSNNTKIVVIGTGKDGLPIILGADK